MFLQVFHVGIAIKEPQQLVDDTFQMQFLGGQERETLAEWIATLCAENADGARSCTVTFHRSFLEDTVKYV